MREFTPSRRSSLRSISSLVVASAALAPSAFGQLDYTVSDITVSQAVQNGGTKLVQGRTTYLRASVDVTGTTQPVDGILRIFDANDNELPGSPVFSLNGPFPANPTNLDDIDGTLNFQFVGPTVFVPRFEVEINPAGPNFVAAETDTSNNVLSKKARFLTQATPELAYVPIDYQFGTVPNPNLPDPDLIRPGLGDSFLQGIYPVSDWFYHRSDMPSKLWTASLSGSGSALNASLATDRLMMVPIPDFIYGWIPGGLPYNGQAQGIPGVSAMGNTQDFKHQRTFAHEIGHLLGLSHPFGSLTTASVNIDVEHGLNEPLALGQVKGAGSNDIMVPGLNTNQAWVVEFTWNDTFENGAFAQKAISPDPLLVVSGVWNVETGEIDVQDLVDLERGGELTAPALLGDANFFVRAYSNGVLTYELPLALTSPNDLTCEPGHRPSGSGDSGTTIDPLTAVTATLPIGDGIDRLVLVDPLHPDQAVSFGRTANAPTVAFAAPTDGLVTEGTVSLAWEGADADGDELTYYLRYSPDGTRSVPLLTGTNRTSWEVDLRELPHFVDGQGHFELLASDGLRTSRAQSVSLSSASSYAGGGGNAPWVEVMTPDDGKSYPFGATVLLHSSGWDLEDRGLTGASIQWTSDVDGPLGSGRVASASMLSVGTHVITVTATDADFNTATDSKTITILARDLPVAETCQASLGFAGPGNAFMTICGDPLASGGLAALQVSNAPATTPGVLWGSLSNNPTPIFGGTVVTNPLQILVALPTNPLGEASAVVVGGSGPVTLYLQYLYIDATIAPDMIGITNALQVDFLP